jgi:hypothetical protein
VEAFPLRVLPPPIEIPHLKEVAQWHKYRDSDTAIAWLRDLLCKVAVGQISDLPVPLLDKAQGGQIGNLPHQT